MKKTLICALAALFPATALADGIGMTAHMGVNESANAYYSSPFQKFASIDFRAAGLVVQADLLETLHSFARKEIDADGDDANAIHLGVGIYKTSDKDPISKKTGMRGVIQPGGYLAIDTNTGTDPMYALFQGGLRMGAQQYEKGGMGIGIYINPVVGFAKTYAPDDNGEVDDKFDLAVGSYLQISTWKQK
jgi:hypothetical protein